VVERQKSWVAALVLSILLGHLGIDRFYLGYPFKGLLKLVSLGGFGVWWIYDIVVIAVGELEDADGLGLRH
jgi:TM2 domain-containing membrane protein YozV